MSIPDAALQLRHVEEIGRDLELSCGNDTSSCSAELLLIEAGITLDGPFVDGTTVRYRLGSLLLSGGDVARASISEEQMGNEGQQGNFWALNIELTEHATEILATATTHAVGSAPPRDQIAIIVDGTVVASPSVVAPIENGTLQISGLSPPTARSLAEILGVEPP